MISTDAVTCPKCGQPLDQAMWDASRAKRLRQGQWVLGVIGAFIIAVVLINAFDLGKSQNAPTNLFKMSAVFVGNPEEQAIQGYVDRIAQRMGIRPTEAIYGQWGSVLVAARKATANVTEMEILRCVDAANVAADFTSMVAICGTSLDLQ